VWLKPLLIQAHHTHLTCTDAKQSHISRTRFVVCSEALTEFSFIISYLP